MVDSPAEAVSEVVDSPAVVVGNPGAVEEDNPVVADHPADHPAVEVCNRVVVEVDTPEVAVEVAE